MNFTHKVQNHAVMVIRFLAVLGRSPGVKKFENDARHGGLIRGNQTLVNPSGVIKLSVGFFAVHVKPFKYHPY